MNASRDSRTAVDKALALLDAFGEEHTTGVGVSELARRTNLSKSTAFRVLAMLERNGAVERAGIQYRLGPFVQRLSAPKATSEDTLVRDTLTPFLVNLYERTRHTVHLAVLERTDVIYLNKLHGLHQVPSPSRVGGRIPAYCTAVGKALLAYHPDEMEEVLGGELHQWTPHTVTDPQVLRQQILRSREEGLAHDREEIMDGLHCVAAVVTSPTGGAVAAMSVSGPSGRFVPSQVAPALRAICADAGRAYGQRFRADRRAR
ncbi:IclR family transcriptional regulator [Luteococcus japonicus]|uniref:IclR family transcriptional regulator n=1 Tax=Luteococcus japonicus TaxID=33984 RepID=A0A3N1ZWS3_9ACTN|nr:IclR family transcriptional regulator [Luteococcus japonicus]ROR55188.1 IclR family transcriptional regulator [Luteococcus japonicus]